MSKIFNISLKKPFFSEIFNLVAADCKTQIELAKTVLIFPSVRSANGFKDYLIRLNKPLLLPKIYSLNNVPVSLDKKEILTDYEKIIKILEITAESVSNLNEAVNLTNEISSTIYELTVNQIGHKQLLEVKNNISHNLSEIYEKNLEILIEVWRKYEDFLAQKQLIDRENYALTYVNTLCEYVQNTQNKVYLCGLIGHDKANLKVLQACIKNPFGRIIFQGFEGAVGREVILKTDPFYTPTNTLKHLQIVAFDNPHSSLVKPEIATAVFQKITEEVEFIKHTIFNTLTQNKSAKIAILTNNSQIAENVLKYCQTSTISVSSIFSTQITATAIFHFFLELVNMLKQGLKPIFLLSLIKSDFLYKNTVQNALVMRLEREVMRQKSWAYFKGDFDEFINNIRVYLPNGADLADFLGDIYAKIKLIKGRTFKDFLHTHLDCFYNFLDKLSAKSDVYEEFEAFVRELKNTRFDIKCESVEIYIKILQHIASLRNFRPHDKRHGSVFVLNTLEIQLLEFDKIIISGFNEGEFSKASKEDYFIPQNAREILGLRVAKETYGLELLHLVLSINKQSVITRALGLNQANLSSFINFFYLEKYPISTLKYKIVRENTQKKPAPTSVKRLKKPFLQDFSPTSIKMLISNPYIFYIQYILKLRPLIAPQEEVSEADIGLIFHSTLREFFDRQTESSLEKFYNLFRDNFAKTAYKPSLCNFFIPKLQKVATRFLEQKNALYAHGTQVFMEEIGSMRLADKYTLKATADRLDYDPKTNFATIIDYKKSSLPSKKNILSFDEPQIPTEILIAKNGGFSAFTNVSSVNAKLLSILSETEREIGSELDLAEFERFLIELIEKYESAEAEYLWGEEDFYTVKFKHFARI
jgi:RecB family exonuclease